ncbi:MAG TPA: 50S ribosomal protein L15 [Ferrovibrio sp.]|uniref:50S ribosomal protein L15 n=1 Tax=Ferrovibrio sp. TaxID=1917215 RepID=UPI002B4AFC0F|nr:50S ribosomal protein L15 [Ferrovibrio sp.]HLT77572.1 50S ribosomal protein L15 [Ferrovibrio sp.]
MRLNQIADNPGARKERMRVGRGIGSGKGKTSGRGVKGQKARTGVSINGFEGGQTPIYRRLPKRGFNPLHPSTTEAVNIGRLQAAIDKKKIDAAQPIDEAVLKKAGLCSRTAGGIRLLGTGELKAKVNITVTGASASAKAAVEKAGGSITVLVPPKAETAAKAEKPKGKKK